MRLFRGRDRSEEILETLVIWNVSLRGGESDPGWDRAAKVADCMLYAAALIFYEDRIDRMSSDAGARWIRARCDRMVADAAEALREPEAAVR